MSATDKAFDILFLLAKEARELGVSELGRMSGLDKASTYRAIKALERYDFVEQNPVTKRYRLGLSIVRLAGAKLRQMPLSSVAQPLLTRLSQETGETVQLSVLDDGRVLYIAVVEGPQPIRVAAGVGAHGPLHATAAGKLFLAFDDRAHSALKRAKTLQRYTPKTIVELPELEREIERIRARGFSTDDEGFVEHLRAAAAPIRDMHGRMVAAIAAGGPSTRVGRKRLEELGAAVTRTAADISRLLAHERVD